MLYNRHHPINTLGTFCLKGLPIYEDMLLIHSLKDLTCSTDIFNFLHTIKEVFQLDKKKLVSITTNGSSIMLGQNSGFMGIVFFFFFF